MSVPIIADIPPPPPNSRMFSYCACNAVAPITEEETGTCPLGVSINIGAAPGFCPVLGKSSEPESNREEELCPKSAVFVRLSTPTALLFSSKSAWKDSFSGMVGVFGGGVREGALED